MATIIRKYGLEQKGKLRIFVIRSGMVHSSTRMFEVIECETTDLTYSDRHTSRHPFPANVAALSLVLATLALKQLFLSGFWDEAIQFHSIVFVLCQITTTVPPWCFIL